jgi:1-acyl-sn-glycerol-3-phosphate acyltransferase
MPSSAVKNTVAPAAKDFFFENSFRAFLVRCAFSAFPLDRGENFFEGLRACARLLKAGKSMVLFPEGTRSQERSLMPFKPGIGMLSLELGVSIVPVYINGSDKVPRKGTLIPRPHRVRLAFGEPILLIGRFLLGESIGVTRIIGVGVIVLGMFLVAK